MVGYFIGYSKTKAGYRILLGDTTVTSVHVLFDESVPERSADYYRELDEATVKVDHQERHVSDFDWLVGQHYMEDGLLYKTTRVVVRKVSLLAFVLLLLREGSKLRTKLSFMLLTYNP